MSTPRKDVLTLKMVDAIVAKIDALKLKEPSTPKSGQKHVRTTEFESKIPHYLRHGSKLSLTVYPRELKTERYLLDLLYEADFDMEDHDIAGFLVAMSAYIDLFVKNGGVIDNNNFRQIILAAFFLALNVNLDGNLNYYIFDEMIIGGVGGSDIKEVQAVQQRFKDEKIRVKTLKERNPTLKIKPNFEDFKPLEAFINLKNDFLNIVGFENLIISREDSNRYLQEVGITQIEDRKTEAVEIEQEQAEEKEVSVSTKDLLENFEYLQDLYSDFYGQLEKLKSKPSLFLIEDFDKCCQTFFNFLSIVIKIICDDTAEENFSKVYDSFTQAFDSIKSINRDSVPLPFFKNPSMILRCVIIENIEKIKEEVDEFVEKLNLVKPQHKGFNGS